MGRTPYLDAKRKAVFEQMDLFPDAPTKQLARIIYKQSPEFFLDLEACRTYVRRYRGQCGNASRDETKIRTYYKPIQKV